MTKEYDAELAKAHGQETQEREIIDSLKRTIQSDTTSTLNRMFAKQTLENIERAPRGPVSRCDDAPSTSNWGQRVKAERDEVMRISDEFFKS